MVGALKSTGNTEDVGHGADAGRCNLPPTTTEPAPLISLDLMGRGVAGRISCASCQAWSGTVAAAGGFLFPARTLCLPLQWPHCLAIDAERRYQSLLPQQLPPAKPGTQTAASYSLAQVEQVQLWGSPHTCVRQEQWQKCKGRLSSSCVCSGAAGKITGWWGRRGEGGMKGKEAGAGRRNLLAATTVQIQDAACGQQLQWLSPTPSLPPSCGCFLSRPAVFPHSLGAPAAVIRLCKSARLS